MKIYAHRGYSGCYPENTMLAFRKAAECHADGIELDVQLSKDGVVMVCHDEKLDRTTDGSGNLRDYTSKELEKFNAAELWKAKYGKEHIPTFDEYCEWATTVPLVTNIELKTGVVYYPEIEQETLSIIDKYDLRKKVIFSSFNHCSLIAMQKLAPEIPLGALVEGMGIGNAGYYCKKFGFQYYHPDYKALNDAVVQELKEHHVGMNVWTVNGMGDLEQLRKWGVDGAITNYCSVGRAYIDGLEK